MRKGLRRARELLDFRSRQASFRTGTRPPAAASGTKWGEGIISHRSTHLGPPWWACALTLAVVLTVPASPALFAQSAQDPEGRPILGITVEGLARLSAGEVLASMQLKIGQPFSRAQLNAEYQRLWKSGEFFTIAEPVVEFEDEGVRIRFVVREKRRVTEVEFHGLRKIRRPEIEPTLKTRSGQLYSPLDVQIDRQRIRRLYLTKGFNFVNVTPEVENAPTGTSVTFRVYEGPRVSVRGIRFNGNVTFSESELIKQIRTRPRSFFFGIPHTGYFDLERFMNDIELVKLFYRQHGFFDVLVAAEDFAFSPGRDHLYLGIRIEEGPRYDLAKIEFDIVGDGIFDEEALRRETKMQTGEPFDSGAMVEDRDRLLKLYQRRAYIDCRIDERYIYDDERRELTLIYQISEGKEIWIRGINVRGNFETKDKVIYRELTFYPQEKMDFEKFAESESNLYRLGFFDPPVRIYPDLNSTAIYRDVNVDVIEGSTGQFLFGFGLTSGLGAVGNFRIVKRNFDMFDLPENFFDLPRAFTGAGQTLVLEAQPGSEVSRYQVSFIEPYVFDTNTSFAIRFQRNQFRSFEYEEDRTGIRVAFGHRFLDKRLVAELSYRFDLIDISDVEADAPPDAFLVEGDNRVSALGISLNYDQKTYRGILGPVEGWAVGTSFEYAGGFLGADVDQSKFSARFSAHKTLFGEEDEERHLLTFRTVFQWAEPHHNTSSIPIFERYFLGGARNVRGFRFLELGPHTAGEPVGGATAHYANLEYTFPIYDILLRGIVFSDVGNLAKKFREFAGDEYRLTVGAGVIINVPLFGQRVPISLTWGEAILDEPEDRTRLFLFDINAIR